MVDAGMRRGEQSDRRRLVGVGVGDFQVGGVPGQERMWGAGVTERCYDNDRYRWGAVGGGK